MSETNTTTPQEEDRVEKFIAFLQKRAVTHQEEQQQKRKEREDRKMPTRRLPYKDDD